MRYHVRLVAWTGPSIVKQLAQAARDAGIEDVLEGTEHIYGTVDVIDRAAAPHEFLRRLEEKHGTSYGLRPSMWEVRP